ncbi:plasmid replication protein RepC [Acidiphilium multivorum]|uniref:plasmid replication protein RepC n=1 Tax=Acidiphilium multivorum TaxID=62140 RepID=UPI001B8B0D8B|nr:plasmid replication protein RepC [Acidiphilium multivorum]MBS3025410.1 replication protein C [Acidiphilium multivorum]
MPTIGPAPGQKTKIKQPPNGFRRLSPAMLATGRTAENFTGLSDGEGSPGAVLAAFKAAAPYLGLSHRAVHAVDWLFRFTQKQDWEPGSRPVVWPSAFMQSEALGLGLSQMKALNRHLVELGLVVMKDSPNGKRYGRRNKAGRIIEAYGFDLSPLAVRMEEFRAMAERGRETREAIRQLRRRASIASTGLLQIAATAAEYGVLDLAWQSQAEETQKLARRLAKADRLDELCSGVAHLERRQQEARERLEALLLREPNASFSESYSVETGPKGPENKPHNTATNQTFDPSDTVIAREKSKSVSGGGEKPSAWDGLDTCSVTQADWNGGKKQIGQERSISGAQRQLDRAARTARTDSGPVMRITPDELIRLAPRLKPYLAKGSPSWPEIVEAADWLRHDLGVSKPLWGDACLAMGREHAAIALAIVSTKPADYFRGSAGGYFHGMVAKARAGDLNLSRTIWGMRSSQATMLIRGSAIASSLHKMTTWT